MLQRIVYLIFSIVALGACASFPEAPARSQSALIDGDQIVSIDGTELPLMVWRADVPKAVIIALHGMNDYANAFALPGAWWAEHGITTYAYDQRGFGATASAGRWPGAGALTTDLRASVQSVKAIHPDTPVYVLGHSMGAAVVLTAMQEASLDVDGAILVAPGIWGGSRMPLFYRIALNMAATFAPGKTLTGERAGRQATDNIPILRAMIADPLVIKETRIDAVLGVTRIMGKGWDATDEIRGDTLMLIGEKDDIIPVKALNAAAKRLEKSAGDQFTVARFDNGWHMLLRDLEAEKVWRVIADWVGGSWIDADETGEKGAGKVQAPRR